MVNIANLPKASFHIHKLLQNIIIHIGIILINASEHLVYANELTAFDYESIFALRAKERHRTQFGVYTLIFASTIEFASADFDRTYNSLNTIL